MERAITMVLSILDNRMRKIEIGGEMMAGLSYVTNDNPSPERISPENKCEGELREVAARLEVTSVFTGGRWFRLQIECEDFAREKIPEGQFHWFIDIVIYLKFVTEENISTLESQRDKVHAAEVRKTKEQYIFISDFKTDIPPILGGLREGK